MFANWIIIASDSVLQEMNRVYRGNECIKGRHDVSAQGIRRAEEQAVRRSSINVPDRDGDLPPIDTSLIGRFLSFSSPVHVSRAVPVSLSLCLSLVYAWPLPTSLSLSCMSFCPSLSRLSFSLSPLSFGLSVSLCMSLSLFSPERPFLISLALAYKLLFLLGYVYI